MAVTLKENSGRSRTEPEGPAGRLLQSSWDPRTHDRQKTQDTCQRDDKGRTDGRLTDCIWWSGGVVWGNGGGQGAAEVYAGKKIVILGERLRRNRDLGSHSEKQHDMNNRFLRKGEEPR